MEIKKSNIINKLSKNFFNKSCIEQAAQLNKNKTLKKNTHSESILSQSDRIRHLLAKSSNLLTLIKITNEDLSKELLGKNTSISSHDHHGEER